MLGYIEEWLLGHFLHTSLFSRTQAGPPESWEDLKQEKACPHFPEPQVLVVGKEATSSDLAPAYSSCSEDLVSGGQAGPSVDMAMAHSGRKGMEDRGLDTAGVQGAWKESVWTEEEGRATLQGGVSKGSPQAEL